MAGGDERQDAEQHRDGEAARAEPPPRLGEHRLHLRLVVQRLGHDEVRAGGELPLQAVPLGDAVVGGRVERAGDRERGLVPDRRPGLVLAPVEPGEDLDQPDRVDVPHAGAGRVVADPRRIAGQREDVADAERVRAQQLRLERHEVPVAGRRVDDALEVEVVLDPERDGHRAHPHAGHRGVADVDEVRARVAQQPRGVDRALDPDAPRRVDLDRHDEPARRASACRRGASPAGGSAMSIVSANAVRGPEPTSPSCRRGSRTARRRAGSRRCRSRRARLASPRCGPASCRSSRR